MKEFTDIIDRDGKPYDPESGWPAGGGLHKGCKFNAEALYGYYTLGNRDRIGEYLTSKGFKETLHGDNIEVWCKGDTAVIYECYDGIWAYMHTEKI